MSQDMVNYASDENSEQIIFDDNLCIVYETEQFCLLLYIFSGIRMQLGQN